MTTATVERRREQTQAPGQAQWRAESAYVHVLVVDGREVGHMSRWTGGDWLGYVGGTPGHVALGRAAVVRRAVEQAIQNKEG